MNGLIRKLAPGRHPGGWRGPGTVHNQPHSPPPGPSTGTDSAQYNTGSGSEPCRQRLEWLDLQEREVEPVQHHRQHHGGSG